MFTLFTVKELVCVINQLNYLNNNEFRLHYPLMDLDLCEIKLMGEKTIENIPDKNQYSARHDALKEWYIKNNNQYAARELPDWNVYKSSYLQSGIIKYVNKVSLKEEVANTLSRDILKGHPSAYIAFDTNMLLDRFFSTFVLQDDELKNKPLSFLLTDIVRDELTFSYKYSDRDLESILANPELSNKGFIVDNFWNQNKLKDRIQRLGYIEYNKIQNNMNFHNCGYPGDFGNKNDMKIIQNYQSFASAYTQILLLSRDFDFIAIAQGRAGIKPLMAELPKEIQFENPYSWDRICELIYIWSVIYGCIELKKDDSWCIRFYGLWRGKEPSDWTDDKIALDIQGIDLSDVLKDIEICKKLGKI